MCDTFTFSYRVPLQISAILAGKKAMSDLKQKQKIFSRNGVTFDLNRDLK